MKVLALLSALAVVGCGDDGGGSNPPDGGGNGDGAMGGDGGMTADAGPTVFTLTTFLGEVQANVPFVARQLGSGPWEPVEGIGGIYTFEVGDGPYGVAYICDDPILDYRELQIIQATGAELRALTRMCTRAPAMTGAVNGAITGLSTSTAGVVVSPYGTTVTANVAEGGGYSVASAIGTYDLGSWRVTGGLADAVLFKRDLAVATGVLTQNLDYATDGIALQTVTMNATNATSGETVTGTSEFHLHTGGKFGLPMTYPTFPAVPSASLRGNDVQWLRVNARDDTAGSRREVTIHAKAPTTGDVTLLDPLTAAVTVVATTPPNYNVTFDAIAGADYTIVNFYQAAGSRQRFFAATLTQGWLTGTTGQDYTLPDLAGVTGWNAEWDQQTGSAVTWQAIATETNRDIMEVLSFSPTGRPDADEDGRIDRSTRRFGQVQP